jgi:short-subunit dehydrogenase
MAKQNCLITGASEGIGRELAKLFASDGYGLALVARNETRLKELAEELQREHKIPVHVVVKDLAKPDASREIFDSLKDFPIGILVNNAGSGVYGYFKETNLASEIQMLHLNMLALVELTKFFLPPMLAGGDGKILNVGSAAAFQPIPKQALYAASKAFVYSFSNALALELEGSGVTVTTLSPGTTQTKFHERSKVRRRQMFRDGAFKAMTAEAVAQAGYRALMAGKKNVVPGLMTKLMAGVSKRLPPEITGRLAAKLNEER